MNKIQNRNRGFTFIELLIVIAIISMSLPIIFGIFFINLQVQSKVYSLQRVKREGDTALSAMRAVIRQYATSIHSSSSATDLNEVCTSANPTHIGDLYFKDQHGNTFRFYKDAVSEKIASQSARTETGGSDENFNETSSAVTVTNWLTSCTRTSPFSPPLVAIAFTISHATASIRTEDNAMLYYQTTIKLRN